jgi:ribonuclease PH
MQFRNDGRALDEIRPVEIIPDYIEQPIASVLYRQGRTWVLAAIDADDQVPRHAKDRGEGWLTADYALLPASTRPRTPREARIGRQSGRTVEIQRIIGRSLRAVVDLYKIPDVSIYIDCDVLQADGGTRTASITAAYIALAIGIERLIDYGKLAVNPLNDTLAAISCGIVQGFEILDMNYNEDAMAAVDLNLAITGSGRYVEIQGTAEGRAIGSDELDRLLGLAQKGVRELIATMLEKMESMDIRLPSGKQDTSNGPEK